MQMIDIINLKKQGMKLTSEQIQFLIDGYTNGSIPDYQMSAFLMAVFLKGMDDEEATSLAISMQHSGNSIDLSSIKGIKVDKHSTGGVGDKVSLVLGPLVAHLGAKLAKMSGRGLGHTGGTIDKLESIPGFKVELSMDEFKDQVNKIGVAIIGQSENITPADKKIYALRDVTGTVESIPLIASSIMSKKLASGSDVICLDVKVGSGAFMKDLESARKLSKLMVSIGKLANRKVVALLTSMDEPLGHKIGNGLEVYESIETLKGQGPDDLIEVVSIISGHLLFGANIAKSVEDGYKLSKETLKGGKAFYKFKEFIKAQGGDLSYIENPKLLYSNTDKYELKATKTGYVESIECIKIGEAAMYLGAGRMKKDDKINLHVGLDLHKKIGDFVNEGDTIITVYHDNEKGLNDALNLLNESIVIGNKHNNIKLIFDTIT